MYVYSSPQVMIDLETFSSANNAVIVSLGAVRFDAGNPEHEFDKFYCTIDPKSCTRFGLSMDADTVMWWMDKDRDDARAGLLAGDRLDLPSALEGFAQWFGQTSVPVWGNGATFDNVILRNAYTAVGQPCPWKFWHDRCHRTIKNLAPDVLVDFHGEIAHNALTDAVAQTEQLLKIVKKLGIKL